MNYRERMRKAIECSQFRNSTYGEYGTLRLDQRKNIKRLLDEMDRADEVIKHQYFELERYKNIVHELETYLQRKYCEYVDMESDDAFVISLVLDTLRELKGE